MIPIINYSEFNTNSIRIKKPIVVGNRKVYALKTSSDSDILVQSPRCIIPYSSVLFDNNKYQIDILTDNIDFIEFLKAIYDHVYSKISKKTKSDMIRDNYYLKKYDDVNYRIRLRNENVNTVSCYCNQKCSIDYNQICRDDRVICIFTLDRFIISSDFTIFNLKVCQIKKCDASLTSMFSNCLVIEDTVSAVSAVSTEKYKKMKKVGVPDDSIRQKMKLDGLSQAQISMFFAPPFTSPSLQHPQHLQHPLLPPPPPPPPPPPLSFLKSIRASSSTPQFIVDIKSGNFKLKSIVNNPQKDTSLQSKNTKLNGVDKSKYAPSLDDILNAKKKLKNI